MVEDIPAIVAWPGRNAPKLGFQAIDPAHRGWHTDRTTSIIAYRQRPHPRRNLGCSTSRRATRRTAQFPGIVGSTEHEIISCELAAIIGGIGFCENRAPGRS